MAQEQLDYRTLRVGLRAPRVAIVVDGSDDDWVFWFRQATFEAGRLWGGSGFVVIPHRDGAIEPALLRGCAAYDPDLVLLLTKTLGLVEALHPGKVRITDEDSGQLVPCDERASLISRQPHVPANIPADSTARQQLSDACSPLRYAVGDAVTEIGRVLRPGDVPPKLRARLPDPDDGLVADKTQLASPSQQGDIVGLVASLRVGMIQPPALPDKVTPADEHVLPWLVTTTLANGTEYPPRSLQHGHPVSLEFQSEPLPYAWTATETGLTPLQRGPQQRVYLVIGEHPSDIGLHILLDRLYGRAAWLPQPVTAGRLTVSDPVVMSIYDFLDAASLNGLDVWVTSTSVPKAELDAFVESLIRAVPPSFPGLAMDSDPARPTIRVCVADGLDWPGLGMTHLGIRGDYQNEIAVPVRIDSAGTVAMVAAPPEGSPRDQDLANELGPNWFVDTELNPQLMPRGRGLQPEAIGIDRDRELTPVRSGRDGASYPCRSDGFIVAGTPQHYQLARIKVRELSLFDWAAAIAAQHGHEIRYSDAGRRSRTATSLWPTRTDAVTALTGPLLPVFTEYGKTGKSTTEIFPDDDGCHVAGLGNFLTFDGIKRTYGVADSPLPDVRAVVDTLTGLRVLRRGLLLQCHECAGLDLYPIDDLGSQNSCRRCGNVTPLNAAAWHRPVDEPRWFYGLHPAVRDIVTKPGGIEPLHLAASLRARTKFTSDVAEILALHDGKAIAECDLLAVIDNRIVIAEVKKHGSLSKAEREDKAAKLAKLANLLRADEIVLATADETWDNTPTIVRQRLITETWRITAPHVTEVTGLRSTIPGRTPK